MKKLFAYGTLMCDDLMYEVSGCRPSKQAATLTGFVRRKVSGEQYPAIKPDKTNRVVGVVYQNIPDQAWVRLDEFEGDMYSRQVVNIVTAEGENITAETYVINPSHLDCLSGQSWDFDEFMATGKAIFEKQYKGFY